MQDDSKLMNYTTEVPAPRTIADIERLLSKFGARQVIKDYDDGEVVAFIFTIPTQSGRVIPFRMPVDVNVVYERLMSKYTKPHKDTTKRVRDQAERVAWRIQYDWLRAQLTMIQLQGRHPEEIFLPYAWNQEMRKTFFQIIEETGFRALNPGHPEPEGKVIDG